jgi:hypothetical protein
MIVRYDQGDTYSTQYFMRGLIGLFRGRTSGSTARTASSLDQHEIIKKSFDLTTLAMRTKDVGGSFGGAAHDLDEHQVWKRVFDEATNSIRIIFG